LHMTRVPRGSFLCPVCTVWKLSPSLLTFASLDPLSQHSSWAHFRTPGHFVAHFHHTIGTSCWCTRSYDWHSISLFCL
jgi:hypothetical protein